MPGKTTPHTQQETLLKRLPKKDISSAIDELPDFHDPYSDLSLFLSGKIKEEMTHHGGAKKWSLKIQDDLLKKITPDFQKAFPGYRLGIAALRKTWDKIGYFLQELQGQKEAVTEKGTLNTLFFVKENLRQYALFKNPYHLQPYHWAYQLAMKLSECLAVMDGAKPKIDHLTRMIWAMQRHLLPKNLLAKSPYDENDTIDQLIVKLTLEQNTSHLSQEELALRVSKAFNEVKEGKRFDEEYAALMVDHPESSHAEIDQAARQLVQRMMEIAHSKDKSEVERKIQNWTMQNDLLLRAIKLDGEAPLLALICASWKEGVSHEEFVREIAKSYLEHHPHLATYTATLMQRIWTLYKYAWYTTFSKDDESAVDRFVKWHMLLLKNEALVSEHCKRAIPMIPCEREEVRQAQ